jgi:hypothetical protein
LIVADPLFLQGARAIAKNCAQCAKRSRARSESFADRAQAALRKLQARLRGHFCSVSAGSRCIRVQFESISREI